MRLILASASPRRRELLGRLGLPFDVWPSGAEELLRAGVPAPTQAVDLARAKARSVAEGVRRAAEAPAVILGADTLVVVEGRPLGKPGSRDEARRMLRTLRDRGHEVVTGVALFATADGREMVDAVTSRVLMRAYDDAEIEAYVATGEPDDKAGAYAVLGIGGHLVARVDGCFTNVVGLPLGTTARLLRAFGLSPADPSASPSGSSR
jgi:septum formation protein